MPISARSDSIWTAAAMPGRRTWRLPSGRGVRAEPWGGSSPDRTPPVLDAALTVFELAELKGRGDVQGVVLMLVVFLATQRMYHGPRTRAKAIVIDEAWDLLSGENSRAFLEGAARRARKYRGRPWLPAPSRSTTITPIRRHGRPWENSDWVIFLAQKDESVELLKQEKRIHCDPGMERALKSLTTADGRYAEMVLHGPDGWRVARLVLDPWSVALFSSRGPAFSAVEKLKAEGLSTIEAIDRIVGGTDSPTGASRREQNGRDGSLSGETERPTGRVKQKPKEPSQNQSRTEPFTEREGRNP